MLSCPWGPSHLALNLNHCSFYSSSTCPPPRIEGISFCTKFQSELCISLLGWQTLKLLQAMYFYWCFTQPQSLINAWCSVAFHSNFAVLSWMKFKKWEASTETLQSTVTSLSHAWISTERHKVISALFLLQFEGKHPEKSELGGTQSPPNHQWLPLFRKRNPHQMEGIF